MPVSRRFTLAVLAGLASVLSGCSTADSPLAVQAPLDGTESRVLPWESNAAAYWNEVAREMVISNRSSAPFAIRGYAIVAVAQYNAAIAAEDGKVRNEHPSVRAAIGAASVAALAYLYPAAVGQLEARLDAFLALPGRPGTQRQNPEAGESIGRTVAQQVIERAMNDRFFAPGTLPVPVGPGLWFSANPPVGPLWGQAHTYILDSGDQLRPPAPPAFGSAEFTAALQEVRQISDSRTAEQAALAVLWDAAPGTYTPPGFWNELGAELAVQYRLGDRETAHLFALMNMVSFDAIVASHEAKYHYWLLRPNMADDVITTAVGQPNFPSYPSNHATVSAGMAHILANRFPAERSRLDALAEEAAYSRVLGGIHYRFDGEAGLVLGRGIADLALANDVVGHEPVVLR